MTSAAPDRDEIVRLGFEVDPVLTLGELRKGPRDRTIRFERGVVWRAARTSAGAATMRGASARTPSVAGALTTPSGSASLRTTTSKRAPSSASEASVRV